VLCKTTPAGLETIADLITQITTKDNNVPDIKNNEVEAPEKSKKGILKWLILLVLLAALGGGGFFAYQHFFASKVALQDPATPGASAGSQEEKLADNAGSQQSQMFSMPSFVVNLADPLGRRYLKMSLDIEVRDEAALEKTEQSMPRIKDSLLLLLSSKSYTDLSSMEDKLALKNEILSRLNQIVGNGTISNVYFTEFIIQ
jgi:flagellar FliL protein